MARVAGGARGVAADLRWKGAHQEPLALATLRTSRVPPALLRAAGDKVMTILSDPYAEPAYIHMGARRVAMRPSDVFKGRQLPWLEMDL